MAQPTHAFRKSRLCVSAGPLTKQAIQTVLKLEQEQARAKGYTNWPAGLTAAFAASAPDQTCLFTANINGRAVAHMLFLMHGQHATYHIGHTTPQGRKLCAHNLLLWRGARFLARQGYVGLDLGLMNTATKGLNRFKLRSGAYLQKTGGTWLYWQPFARRKKMRLVA
jgi:lipid II:glycine glycyltransferase (peptidoglycan interpeptide bridge formation enzyme)